MPDAAEILANVNTAANDIQAFANALADRIRAGGDVAIRASNTAYGAAGGAKAGASAPTEIPPVVKYGGLAALVYFLTRR